MFPSRLIVFLYNSNDIILKYFQKMRHKMSSAVIIMNPDQLLKHFLLEFFFRIF